MTKALAKVDAFKNSTTDALAAIKLIADLEKDIPELNALPAVKAEVLDLAKAETFEKAKASALDDIKHIAGLPDIPGLNDFPQLNKALHTIEYYQGDFGEIRSTVKKLIEKSAGGYFNLTIFNANDTEYKRIKWLAQKYEANLKKLTDAATNEILVSITDEDLVEQIKRYISEYKPIKKDFKTLKFRIKHPQTLLKWASPETPRGARSALASGGKTRRGGKIFNKKTLKNKIVHKNQFKKKQTHKNQFKGKQTHKNQLKRKQTHKNEFKRNQTHKK